MDRAYEALWLKTRLYAARTREHDREEPRFTFWSVLKTVEPEFTEQCAWWEGWVARGEPNG